MLQNSSTFVELRSEEIQEVLSRPPKWLLRWGITVVLAIIVLIFISAWLIHYPDLVNASFKLTSVNAPKVVLSRTDGKLTRLLIRDGQIVKSGTVIGYLESTAKHEQVINLSNELNKTWSLSGKGDLENVINLHLYNYQQLGEIQIAYQTFEQARVQLRSYLKNGFYSKKRALLQLEITDLKELSINLREQLRIQARDIQLAHEDYEIQQKLFQDKVIAVLDLKREESKNIARQMPFQQTSSALIGNLTAQRAKQKEILELDKQVFEERENFMQSLNTLRSAIDAWMKKYILTAPVNGWIYFNGVLQENQSVAIGQELLFVAPAAKDYYGELHVPQRNAGKVHVGQKVLIKFAGFPYQEFGAVQGHIITIADIPFKDSTFLAKVELPNGLKTTYGQSLTVKIGMMASAEILTDDSRLLEKLFYQLRKMAGGR